MYCRSCNYDMPTVVEHKSGPNHVLHLLLSMFLCGFWVPVWIIIACMDNGKRSVTKCARCATTLM